MRLVDAIYFQVLDVASIGDSGYMILRNGAVHKSSSPMFHEFCFPVQIERGDDPSQLSQVGFLDKNTSRSITRHFCKSSSVFLIQVYQVELDEGDVIVMATNGLFDNLYKQEIASIVSKSLQATKGPKVPPLTNPTWRSVLICLQNIKTCNYTTWKGCCFPSQ